MTVDEYRMLFNYGSAGKASERNFAWGYRESGPGGDIL